MNTTDVLAQEAPKAESEFFTIRTLREALETCKAKVREYNEKYAPQISEKGISLRNGIRDDACLLRERIVRKGRAAMPSEIPMAKTLEAKVTERIHAVVGKAGLASHTDVTELRKTMEALSIRVEALAKRQAD